MFDKRKPGTGPGIAVLVLVLSTTASIGAADTQFIPSVEFSAGRDGNVAVVGVEVEGEGQQRVPDDYVRLLLDLLLRRTTRASELSFRYRPARVEYREADQLDNTEHDVALFFASTVSRRTTLGVEARWYRTQRQGIDPERPDAPVTLVNRTNYQRGIVSVTGETRFGKRSSVSWGGGAWAQDYEDQDLQDSLTGFATLGYGWAYSERGSVGITYNYQHIRYEEAPALGILEDDTLNINTIQVGTKRTFGKNTEGSLGIGAFTAETLDTSVSDPSYNLSITHRVLEKNLFMLGLARMASAGGGQRRATVDEGGYLSWTYTPIKALDLNVNAGFWRRDDLATLVDEPVPGTPLPGTEPGGRNTITTNTTLSWNTGRFVSLGVFHRYNRQEEADAPTASSNTSYNSYGLFLRWNIRGVE